MTATRASLPKRHYVETAFERFCAWPESVLIGNHFYYREDNTPTYLLDVRVPKKMNRLQRFFVSVLFHLLRPMNFLLGKIMNASKRKKLMAIRLTKKDIKLNQDNRSYEALLSLFFRKDDKLQTRLSDFIKKISKPEDWDKKENIADFNAMFHEAALNYPVLLTALQNFLIEDKRARNLNTPRALAERVMSQGTATPYLGFHITYNMLLEMYRAARSRMYIDSANQPQFGVPLDKKFNSSRDDVKAFYDKNNNTIQCQWRRVFNANMKLFRSAIGGEEVYEALKSADHRVYAQAQVDSSKNRFFDLPTPCQDRWRDNREGGSKNFISDRKAR